VAWVLVKPWPPLVVRDDTTLPAASELAIEVGAIGTVTWIDWNTSPSCSCSLSTTPGVAIGGGAGGAAWAKARPGAISAAAVRNRYLRISPPL
jgi:hypothetical protein